jgi:hypothetical protein
LPSDHSRIVQYRQNELGPDKQLNFKITNTFVYNGVVNALKMAGFHYLEHGSDWNVLWTGLFKADKLKNMNSY